MTEEEKLKEIIAQGKGADEWLNHPTFNNVITLLKARYIIAFEQTKFRDRDERDEIWRKMQALTAITQDMEAMIDDARRANDNLAERIKGKIKRVF